MAALEAALKLSDYMVLKPPPYSDRFSTDENKSFFKIVYCRPWQTLFVKKKNYVAPKKPLIVRHKSSQG